MSKPPQAVTRPYHHGDLPAALLQSALAILEQDGIAGLTLRAVARRAGVSHMAPAHHFGDLSGLLSELAAVGYRRFGAQLGAAGKGGPDGMGDAGGLDGTGDAGAPNGASDAGAPNEPSDAGGLVGTADAGAPSGMGKADALDRMGEAYVAFARDNQALFQLMFRSERLDRTRPALAAAMSAAADMLTRAAGGFTHDEVAPSLSQVAAAVHAWSLVHGFALLLIDGRLDSTLATLGNGNDATGLLRAVLNRPASG